MARHQRSFTLVPAAAYNASSPGGPEFGTSQYDEIKVMVNVAALTGTSPTLTVFVDTKDELGNWYQIAATAALNAAGPAQLDIGRGAQVNALFGKACRIRYTIGGTASPTATFSVCVAGKAV